jgi:hypothetical protein
MADRCGMGVFTNQECLCFPEYALVNGTCSYHRISHIRAGAAQFAFPLGMGGIGNLMLGLYTIGCIQMILTFMIWLIIGTVVFTKYRVRELYRDAYKLFRCEQPIHPDKKVKTVITAITGLFILSFMFSLGSIWCIVDGIYLILHNVTDSNGIPTY